MGFGVKSGDPNGKDGCAKTPAAAWVAAILRAKAQEQTNEQD